MAWKPGASAVSRFVRFMGAPAVVGRCVPELWAPPRLEESIAGSVATAVQFPMAAGTAMPGRLELYVLPPLMLLGSLRQQAGQP